jgi:hypothetical protein
MLPSFVKYFGKNAAGKVAIPVYHLASKVACLSAEVVFLSHALPYRRTLARYKYKTILKITFLLAFCLQILYRY